MPASIDASVGGVASNSYLTLSEADTYHLTRLNNTAWTDASGDTKNRALIMATRLLDTWVIWFGTSVNSTQALLWPRLDVLDRQGVEIGAIIPQWLKDATAELALFLLVEDRTTDPETKGFTELQVGSLSLKVDKFDRREVLPESVQAMVQWYGKVKSMRPSVARLVRA